MPVITNNPTTRDLVLAEGYPYILIKVVDPETGGVELTTHGFSAELDVAGALQELALLVAEADAA
jgi:hypothetical protein